MRYYILPMMHVSVSLGLEMSPHSDRENPDRGRFNAHPYVIHVDMAQMVHNTDYLIPTDLAAQLVEQHRSKEKVVGSIISLLKFFFVLI